MTVITLLAFFRVSEEKKLYLPTDESTELYLLAFLRVCKFYPESAFKRVSILFNFHVSTNKNIIMHYTSIMLELKIIN